MHLTAEEDLLLESLRASFKAPFREPSIQALKTRFDIRLSADEAELETGIRRAGALCDRFELIEVDCAARFEALRSGFGIRTIEGYREFMERVRVLKDTMRTFLGVFQTSVMGGRVQAGLSARTRRPARFPAALPFKRLSPLPDCPPILDSADAAVLLDTKPEELERLAELGEIPADKVDGEWTYMRLALQHWLSRARAEGWKRW